MKILELCLSPGLGGLEIYVCRAVEAIARNHDVVTVTLPASLIRSRLLAGGHQVQSLRLRFPRFPLIAAKRLAALVDRLDIDLMHVNWGPDLALAALAKRFSRRQPRLVFSRHMQITRSKDDLYHNFIYRQCDLMLAVTKEMEQRLRHYLAPCHSERIRHLYCGVPAPTVLLDGASREALRREQGLPVDAFVAGVFSRLEAAKGQHLLLEAIAMLRDQGIIIYGLIVGKSMNDDYAEGLRQQVNDLGLAGQVVFCDFVEQPQLLMQICDCVVLPTNRETFGLVLVEAMRCGVAVIGSAAGGVPEIIEDGVSGFLFESGNARDLAERLRELQDNPDLRATSGDRRL
ncbi:MAG: glycosyltransferase family 4 protein [Desulfurivibrio sp.]|nr:glycosyltransferase family 4 protein [Desulfurivibrio sp.]